MEEYCAPLGEEIEVSPGLLVRRRCVLATLATLLITKSLPAWGAQGAADRLTYEEFLAQVIPVAKGLVADTSADGQDRYLRAVAAFALRMPDVAPPAQMRDQGKGTFIGANPGGDPFNVLHWRMEPGTEIRTHPHIYGNVVTVGLEGAAEVVNYEMEGAKDFLTPEPFMVRRTVRQTLRPGQVNLVSLERNYMHGFKAGAEGARGLDITTRIRPNQPSPVLLVNDAEAERTQARWLYEQNPMNVPAKKGG